MVQGLGLVAPGPLTGQLAVHVSAGVRYTSTMVHDSIVRRLDVRPALAPTFVLTLASRPAHGWAALAGVDVSTSELQRHEADGTTASLGRISTVAFSVAVEHRLPAGFRATIGAGGIKYFPHERSGIFQRGSAVLAGLGTATLGHALPFGRYDQFGVEARYDVHGFTTPELQQQGFGSSRLVHRVALTLYTAFRVAR